MSLRLWFVVLLFATPFRAADTPDQNQVPEKLQRVNAEVQRRRALHHQAELERSAKEANARRVVEDDAAGVNKATPEELTAAREIIRQADARRAREQQPPNPEEKVMMRLADADMTTWAAAWKIYFGQPVTITDRAKKKSASVKLSVPTPIKDVKPLMIAALKEAGVYVSDGPNGVEFDTEPAPVPPAKPKGTGGKSTQPAR